MKFANRVLSTPVCFIALLMVPVMVLTGCSFSSALSEASKTIALLTPAANLIPPVVCIADPVACPATEAAATVFDAGAGAVSKFFGDWASASQSAQPQALAQLNAALATLQSDSADLVKAAQVKDPNEAAVVNGLVAALVDEVSAVATVISEVKGQGGTIQAFNHVISMGQPVELASLEMPEGMGGSVSPVAIGNPVRIKFHRGKVVHSSKDLKNHLLEHLKAKTGNAAFDAKCKALAKQVKGW